MLPTYCLALMRSFPKEDQELLQSQIDELDAADQIAPQVKSLILGLALEDAVGQAVLLAAVKELADKIQVDPEPAAGHAAGLASG